MVVSGSDGNDRTIRHDFSQVVDMNSTRPCSNLEPYPSKLGDATGGVLNGFPTICGGVQTGTIDKSRKHIFGFSLTQPPT